MACLSVGQHAQAVQKLQAACHGILPLLPANGMAAARQMAWRGPGTSTGTLREVMTALGPKGTVRMNRRGLVVSSAFISRQPPVVQGRVL